MSGSMLATPPRRRAHVQRKLCSWVPAWAIAISAVAASLALGQALRAQNVGTPEGRFEAIDNEVAAKLRVYRQAIQEAKTDEEKLRLAREQHESTMALVRRFLVLAEQEPKARIAPDALRATIVLGRRSPETRAAIEQLRRDWVTSPRIAALCGVIGVSPNPNAEALLREVLAKNPDRAAQGHACLALAGFLSASSQIPTLFMKDPQSAARLESRLGKDWLDQLTQQDPLALSREAEALYERVVDQYADVKLVPELPYGTKLKPEAEKNPRRIGKVAETWLAANREMKPGKPAPEIQGKDIDGKPLKLSDFRGKVVVVTFWASWCGPCVEQIPHERQLAERLTGKPFALLGVNCDRTEAAATAIVAKEKVSWPNWYDGVTGPIADLWHVRAFPTIYVIDPEGVIRDTDVRGAALDNAVDALLSKHRSK